MAIKNWKARWLSILKYKSLRSTGNYQQTYILLPSNDSRGWQYFYSYSMYTNSPVGSVKNADNSYIMYNGLMIIHDNTYIDMLTIYLHTFVILICKLAWVASVHHLLVRRLLFYH